MFSNILITDYSRNFHFDCKTKKEYKTYLKTNPDAVEIIGGFKQQIKPVFDIDAYINDINKDEVIKLILSLFPDKKIVYASRIPRETDKGLKYSYRFYVLGVRITSKKLHKLITDNDLDKLNIFDTSIYKKNGLLYLPYTTKKKDTKTNGLKDVPELIPIDCDLFDCCASYILDHYEDWDLKMPEVEEIKKVEVVIEEVDEVEEVEYNLNILKLTELITKLKKHRATTFDDWLNGMWAIINICKKNNIKKTKIYELVHLFSSLDTDAYDKYGTENWLNDNYNKTRPNGYGWKFLLKWLSEDNKEFYNKLTKKENLIESSNDDEGASTIVINKYKNKMVISKGVFYVLEDNIWICDCDEVNKVLSNFIVSLDIRFVGSDGVRTYSYSNAVKHQKDCIKSIRNNRSIINDNFYNDIIRSNKYYLPFNNGLYSFKDKKLYSYSDLPNVYFTQKINRDYMPKIEKDYIELLDKIINPIYPDEVERDYNAHILSRAMAGCSEDKKWYAKIGSRNSGKGVESKLLKNSFGDFVNEFNSKCLIKSKFGNNDPHRAFDWVADKKNSRIFLCNEIDADDNAEINGILMKLLSGGDEISARQIYEKITQFIPQFMIFIYCNKLCKISPVDAMENLEQFNYKSKFVNKEDLVEGVKFLKLKDDNIKTLINEDRIINAYIHYIIDGFTLERQKTPEVIKNSTLIGETDDKLKVEDFIIKKFKNSDDDKDRLHTEDIHEILKDNGYKISLVETGRMFNSIGIGKFNKNTNIDKVRKGGFLNVKYIGDAEEAE